MRLARKIKKIVIGTKPFDYIVKFVESQSDIAALFIYGSYGTERQTALSDVDLAILPFPQCAMSPSREAEINFELAAIVGDDDINCINLQTVPVEMQMAVLETGSLIYCDNTEVLFNFIENVIRRYCDFEPDLRAIYDDYDAGLKGEFL